MISQAAHRIVAWTGSLASAVLLILVAEQSVLAACVGDCSDDGNVTINELIRGVNIALDTLPLTACQPLDADMNGDVTVNELIIAVNRALNGCSALPSASPTSTVFAGATHTRTSGTAPTPSPTPDNPGACTEDASAFVAVDVESIQVLDRNSPCGNIAPTLQTRTSSVMFTNTHPSRRIAIAAIIIYQSDKRPLPLSPCEYAIQGGAFSSLDECHERIAMGCESPAGLFLDPGQTSGDFFYNCKYEGLYPGSGSCGSMELETTAGSVLAHAVFCDDFDLAQAHFCSAVHTSLLDTGEPVSGFSPITTNDCPP